MRPQNEHYCYIIETAANLIKNYIKLVETCKINYPLVNDISSIDKNLDFIPISLRIFLRKLFLEKNSDRKIASISQVIIQATHPRVLMVPLQIGVTAQMHHHFGSRFLIDSLNSHGFCSSYSEVKKFEVSAADAQDKEIPGFIPGQFAQFIADNVDHNVRTIDGTNTFHGMGIIAVRSPEVRCSKPIARIKKTAEELTLQSRINIKFYRGDITAPRLLKYETYQRHRLFLESGFTLENFIAIKVLQRHHHTV